jgi:hypothetical protein
MTAKNKKKNRNTVRKIVMQEINLMENGNVFNFRKVKPKKTL